MSASTSTRRAVTGGSSRGPAGSEDTAGTRRVLAWIVVAVGVVGVLYLAVPTLDPPYATTSEGATGTDVLRRVLDGLEVEVEEGDADDVLDQLSPDDVAVVFRDQLDDRQEQRLADHVAAGGDVVVAAPGSGPAGGLGVRTGVGAAGPPDCEALPARTVLAADVDAFAGRDATMVPDLVALAESPVQACWVDGDSALVAIYDGVPGRTGTEVEDGRTVVIGDPDLVTNAAIVADPDLAQLATLFVPRDGGRVRVLVGDQPPPVAAGVDGAVPDHLRRGMWLAALGLGLYALAQSRRHGRVVAESPPVEVPASELAGGIAELLERHGQAADAAARLRAGLRADLAPRLGADGREPDVLVPLVTRATGLPADRVALAIGDGVVRGVDDLVAVAAAGRDVRAALATSSDPASGSA